MAFLLCLTYFKGITYPALHQLFCNFCNLNNKEMSKEKEGKAKNDKSAPAMTLKEKRAAKEAKREDKRKRE